MTGCSTSRGEGGPSLTRAASLVISTLVPPLLGITFNRRLLKSLCQNYPFHSLAWFMSTLNLIEAKCMVEARRLHFLLRNIYPAVPVPDAHPLTEWAQDGVVFFVFPDLGERLAIHEF